MSGQQIVATQKVPSAIQRTLRRRASRLQLQAAVRMAVDAFFGFTHRATGAKALWSEAGTVWLGRVTFLHWALDDVEIDIPWVVANAEDAPQDADSLRQAIQSELTAHWASQLTALPRMSTGNWLPLP